jgi:hypothetical protein
MCFIFESKWYLEGGPTMTRLSRMYCPSRIQVRKKRGEDTQATVEVR